MGDGRRSAHFTDAENLYFELTAPVPYFEQIAGPDFTRRLGQLAAALNSTEFAGPGRQGPGFEEPGCPQPFINSNPAHISIFVCAGSSPCRNQIEIFLLQYPLNRDILSLRRGLAVQPRLTVGGNAFQEQGSKATFLG